VWSVNAYPDASSIAGTPAGSARGAEPAERSARDGGELGSSAEPGNGSEMEASFQVVLGGEPMESAVRDRSQGAIPGVRSRPICGMEDRWFRYGFSCQEGLLVGPCTCDAWLNKILLTTSERGGKLLCEIKMVIPLYHAVGRQGCVRRHTGAGKTALLISSYFWRHHA
jgi:hypothetical protein